MENLQKYIKKIKEEPIGDLIDFGIENEVESGYPVFQIALSCAAVQSPELNEKANQVRWELGLEKVYPPVYVSQIVALGFQHEFTDHNTIEPQSNFTSGEHSFSISWGFEQYTIEWSDGESFSRYTTSFESLAEVKYGMSVVKMEVKNV